MEWPITRNQIVIGFLYWLMFSIWVFIMLLFIESAFNPSWITITVSEGCNLFIWGIVWFLLFIFATLVLLIVTSAVIDAD